MPLHRRQLLTAAAGALATSRLAAPAIAAPEAARTIRFIPHADLASLDPVWTTADITRNYSLAVYDTLFGVDANFRPQLQMLEGFTLDTDKRVWELTLRPGLKFHDGEPVLARDAIASIQRWSKRDGFGGTLMAHVDEISPLSDTKLRIRLKKPFPLLPDALANYNACVMPERVARTDPNTQITESVGSGPYRFLANERVPGSRIAFARFDGYVPRQDGTPSFTAGPKIPHIERAEWTFVPDPATSAAAIGNDEYDWWEIPSFDLIPSMKRNRDLVFEVKDQTGEIGCMRFNSLFPPFDNPAIRRLVVSCINQPEFMETVAGATPELIRNPAGLFAVGTPMASTDGCDLMQGLRDPAKVKDALKAAGYDGQKIVVLAASTISTIWGQAQLGGDLLQRMGFDVDFQVLEWGTVVQRRASKEPPAKGGWNIFFTNLGGLSNLSPAFTISARGNGDRGWFGWPTDPEIEAIRDRWFDADGLPAQQALAREMQRHFFTTPSYAPLGMFVQPVVYRRTLSEIRDGFPQMYGVKKSI